MSKNKPAETSIALAPEMTSETSLSPVVDAISREMFEDVLGSGGFESVSVKRVGDPRDGKDPFYLGLLKGPGEPFEMDADKDTGEIKLLPTWVFQPMVKNPDGTYRIADNVTHIVPAPYQINYDCSRIWKVCETDRVRAIVALRYDGVSRSRKGNNVNNYGTAVKYLPLAPASSAA